MPELLWPDVGVTLLEPLDVTVHLVDQVGFDDFAVDRVAVCLEVVGVRSCVNRGGRAASGAYGTARAGLAG